VQTQRTYCKSAYVQLMYPNLTLVFSFSGITIPYWYPRCKNKMWTICCDLESAALLVRLCCCRLLHFNLCSTLDRYLVFSCVYYLTPPAVRRRCHTQGEFCAHLVHCVIKICSKKMEGSSNSNVVSVYIYNGVDAVPEDVSHVRVEGSVTVIPCRAFYGRHQLVEVELPEGLLMIEDKAFGDCNFLKRINIPSTVEEIGKESFYCCHVLDGVFLPMGLRRLGESAFSHCKYLKQINIPPGIQHIGRQVFWDCGDLVDVSLSEGVESIGHYAFGNCNSLASVTLPSSLKVIGENSFQSCTKLQEIYLSDGVETIDATPIAKASYTPSGYNI